MSPLAGFRGEPARRLAILHQGMGDLPSLARWAQVPPTGRESAHRQRTGRRVPELTLNEGRWYTANVRWVGDSVRRRDAGACCYVRVI